MGDPGIISNTSEVSQQVPKNNPTDLGSAENLGFRVDTKSVIIELRDQRFLIHCRDHPSTWYASKHRLAWGRKACGNNCRPMFYRRRSSSKPNVLIILTTTVRYLLSYLAGSSSMDDDQLALTPQRIHSDLQQLAFIIIPRTEGPETSAVEF